MWPFSRAMKALTSENAETTVTVYVRNDMAVPTTSELMEITMVLANKHASSYGATLPSFPFIYQSQFHALPDRLKIFFKPREHTYTRILSSGLTD